MWQAGTDDALGVPRICATHKIDAESTVIMTNIREALHQESLHSLLPTILSGGAHYQSYFPDGELQLLEAGKLPQVTLPTQKWAGCVHPQLCLTSDTPFSARLLCSPRRDRKHSYRQGPAALF